MSFSIHKMNISSQTPVFSFTETLLSPLSSLARTALHAISNIGSLFSERKIFTQAEEAEIERVKQSLLSSPEQIWLDRKTQEYTEKNRSIPPVEKPFDDLVERSPTRISFSEITVEWAFRKDQSPSPKPLPLAGNQNLKPILKRRFNFSEVD